VLYLFVLFYMILLQIRWSLAEARTTHPHTRTQHSTGNNHHYNRTSKVKKNNAKLKKL